MKLIFSWRSFWYNILKWWHRIIRKKDFTYFELLFATNHFRRKWIITGMSGGNMKVIYWKVKGNFYSYLVKQI